MTDRKRIAINALATYGRTVYSVACGLFVSRWVLMALGSVDFGLYGVVGGMVLFVSFLNNVLGAAVSRFYAYEVGASLLQPEDGLSRCQGWFSTALMLHTVIPIILLSVGYPIGCYVVKCFLTVPPDRVHDCLWVWRFACITSFVGMVTVPFSAMFTAKQEIAELTAYSTISTTLNILFVYYMVTHQGVWLAKYAAGSCVISSFPNVIITLRAILKYKECHLRINECIDICRIRKLAVFAGGRMICAFSQLIGTTGVNILVNKILGPVRNSAMSVAVGLANHGNGLTSSIVCAFTPAVTNAAGAGDLGKMRGYVYNTCNFSAFSSFLFFVPLVMELHQVMTIWLKNPPLYCPEVCFWIILSLLVENVGGGMGLGVAAVGRIVKFQACEAIAWVLMLPISYFLIHTQLAIVGVGMAFFIMRCVILFIRVMFERSISGISAREWFRRTLRPLLWVLIFSMPLSLTVRLLMPQSFIRLVCVCVCYESMYLFLSWRMLVPENVKARIKDRFVKKDCI